MYLSVRVVTFTTKSSPPSEEDAEDDKSCVERSSGPKPMRTYTNLYEKSTVELLKKDLTSLSDIYAFKYNNCSKIYLGSSINLSIRTVEHLKNRNSNIIWKMLLRNMA
jgi:hypothetical protein